MQFMSLGVTFDREFIAIAHLETLAPDACKSYSSETPDSGNMYKSLHFAAVYLSLQ